MTPCYGVDPYPRIQRARYNQARADTNIDNVNNSIFERLPRYTTPTIKSLTHPNIDRCQRLSTGSHRQTSDHLLTPARDIPPIIGRYRPTNDGKDTILGECRPPSCFIIQYTNLINIRSYNSTGYTLKPRDITRRPLTAHGHLLYDYSPLRSDYSTRTTHFHLIRLTERLYKCRRFSTDPCREYL